MKQYYTFDSVVLYFHTKYSHYVFIKEYSASFSVYEQSIYNKISTVGRIRSFRENIVVFFIYIRLFSLLYE